MKIVRIAAAMVLVLASHGAQAAPVRDPFARPQPQNAAAAAASADNAADPAPVLRAVIYDPGHSMANLSGRIVMVGDWYGPYRVLRIDERSVTLVRGKEKSVLVLDGESST